MLDTAKSVQRFQWLLLALVLVRYCAFPMTGLGGVGGAGAGLSNCIAERLIGSIRRECLDHCEAVVNW
jgi:hypothetical protein